MSSRENKARTGRNDLKNVKPFTVYLTQAHFDKLEALIAAEVQARGFGPITKSDYIRTLIERQPLNDKPSRRK